MVKLSRPWLFALVVISCSGVGLGIARNVRSADERGIHVSVFGFAADALEGPSESGVLFLRSAGVAIEYEGIETRESEAEAQLERSLVDYVEAREPCDATWRRFVPQVRSGEIIVVVGGTIRSVFPTTVYPGLACSLTRGQRCTPLDASSVGGYVLISRAGSDRVTFEVLVAHEISHILGLTHLDDDDPCPAGVEESRRSPSAYNLMSAPVHSGRGVAGRITIGMVSLDSRQLDFLRGDESA